MALSPLKGYTCILEGTHSSQSKLSRAGSTDIELPLIEFERFLDSEASHLKFKFKFWNEALCFD
jgi:hypothetical protein